MSSQYAIRVVDASVRFNMSSQKIDSLKEYFVKLIRRELMFKEFFALQEVNLTVMQGESWGIIGTNGSGKSTLLKLISGILAPHKGTVETVGQISPMIELGAGFDDNLTARENIFLNGALLGRSRPSMEQSVDAIIAFSGLEQFMEMPLKNYSSGMRARLGFAIATAVRPDILIVDEVLSVGDQAFKEKCQKRMQELLSDGTTLLFVSHSIDLIKSMCDHAIWLDKGRVIAQGASQEVCDAYVGSLKNKK